MIPIKHVLLCCVVANYLILLFWWMVFAGAHDWMYRLHKRWFNLSVETFDALNWAGIAVYKIGILLFNVVPLIAVCLSAR